MATVRRRRGRTMSDSIVSTRRRARTCSPSSFGAVLPPKMQPIVSQRPFGSSGKKGQRIPSGDDARPWLFGVARNVLRRERATADREAEAAHELALAAQRSGAITSTNKAALTALASLSPLDQEIITMLAWDDLAPREVAVILGLSPNVVRVRAHRAREQLRNTLAAGVTEGSKAAITPRES